MFSSSSSDVLTFVFSISCFSEMLSSFYLSLLGNIRQNIHSMCSIFITKCVFGMYDFYVGDSGSQLRTNQVVVWIDVCSLVRSNTNKCLVSINTWSMLFSVSTLGDTYVILCILLCSNILLPNTLLIEFMINQHCLLWCYLMRFDCMNFPTDHKIDFNLLLVSLLYEHVD